MFGFYLPNWSGVYQFPYLPNFLNTLAQIQRNCNSKYLSHDESHRNQEELHTKGSIAIFFKYNGNSASIRQKAIKVIS